MSIDVINWEIYVIELVQIACALHIVHKIQDLSRIFLMCYSILLFPLILAVLHTKYPHWIASSLDDLSIVKWSSDLINHRLSSILGDDSNIDEGNQMIIVTAICAW